MHPIHLKTAEQLVHRLLLHRPLTPSFSLPPPLPPLPALTPLQHAFFTSADPFSTLPPPLDPAFRGTLSSTKQNYGQPSHRAANKKHQLKYLLSLVLTLLARNLIPPNPTILDLCGGCAHLGLAIAALLPNASVTVVDSNPTALHIAENRAALAGLTNLTTAHQSIEHYDTPFHLALALHACGRATDAALALAVKHAHAVIAVPCCVGAIATDAHTPPVHDHHTGESLHWHLPKSNQFRHLLADDEYRILARAADFGQINYAGDSWRRVAKALLETDRCLWLRNAAWHVKLLKMRPLTCTPKNDVIIAWKPHLNKSHHNNNNLWLPDRIANGLITDVTEGSLINGLDPEQVTEVAHLLQQMVCSTHSSGVYHSPAGSGKRRRKTIHAVAETLALHHVSTGKGFRRSVCVTRTPWAPLYFDTYLAVTAVLTDHVCARFNQFVPPKCVERRAFVRGAPHHCTIVTPPEIAMIPPHLKQNNHLCLKTAFDHLHGTQLHILGIGRATTTTSSEHSETYFAVVKWPQAQALRQTFGLLPAHLHITLGFTDKDIHRVPKNASTIIHHFQSHEQTINPWLT